MPTVGRNYKDRKYIKWRNAVFARDEHRCQLCKNAKKQKKSSLEAHHIKKWIDFPELRFVLSNGISLCKEHHTEVTGKEDQYEAILKEHVIKSSVKKFDIYRFRNPRLRM